MDPLFIFMLSVWNEVAGIVLALFTAKLGLPLAMALAVGAVFLSDPLSLHASAVNF